MDATLFKYNKDGFNPAQEAMRSTNYLFTWWVSKWKQEENKHIQYTIACKRCDTTVQIQWNRQDEDQEPGTDGFARLQKLRHLLCRFFGVKIVPGETPRV